MSGLRRTRRPRTGHRRRPACPCLPQRPSPAWIRGRSATGWRGRGDCSRGRPPRCGGARRSAPRPTTAGLRVRTAARRRAQEPHWWQDPRLRAAERPGRRTRRRSRPGGWAAPGRSMTARASARSLRARASRLQPAPAVRSGCREHLLRARDPPRHPACGGRVPGPPPPPGRLRRPVRPDRACSRNRPGRHGGGTVHAGPR